MGKLVDLSNKHFGKLLVVERAPVAKGHGKHAFWKCLCACGNTAVVRSNLLRTGNTKSCGCLTEAEGLSGKTFGKLSVVQRAGVNKWGDVLWECLCACGKEHVTIGKLLINGTSTSCGCNKKYNNFKHGLSYTSEYNRATHSKRKAQKLRNGGSHTAAQLLLLRKEQNDKCHYCGKKLKEWHQEHKVPLSRGGTDDITNMVISCPPCNWSKRDKTEEEFKTFLSNEKTPA